MHVEDTSLLFIEACAGSALLSSVMRGAGFDVLAIDFGKVSRNSNIHVINLDLRQTHSWKFLHTVTLSRRVFHFHGAPPCGTASRARDKALSEHHHGPQPLRSSRYPLGFPWLQNLDKQRVLSANQIYIQMALFCMWLCQIHVGWSIENPGNSYMWDIEQYKQLAYIALWVCFHSCCHGSSRKKLTGLLTNVIQLRGLEAFCQGDHEHQAWGLIRAENSWQFATSKEAAYPRLLCERFATLLQVKCQQQGMHPIPSLPVQTSTALQRAGTGKQSAVNKMPPVLSEFHYITFASSTFEPVLDSKNSLVQLFHQVPVGSRLINEKKGVVRDQTETGSSSTSPLKEYKFGVYRQPHEFVEQAQQLIHPFDTSHAMPEGMVRALKFVLESGPVAVMKHRLEQLSKWRLWADELAQQEKALHLSLREGVAKVVAGKRILLMERIAGEIGWEDKELFTCLRTGFSLTGNQEKTGIFPDDFKPPSSRVEELMDRAKFVKPALWGKIRHEPLQSFSQELWDITVAEHEQKGWLGPPMRFEELEATFQSRWLPVRRFAVMQKNKCRPIDDFSENGVNSCFGSVERVDLRALDEIVWSSMIIMRTLKSGLVDVPGSSQSKASNLHDYWRRYMSRAVPKLKALDLKSAYKQLPLSPSEVSKAVICLKCPSDNEVYGFPCLTLPFGAVASVLHFNRFARYLQRVFWHLGIISSNYFDDYPVLEMSQLCSNTDSTMKAVVGLLGIRISEDKDQGFNGVAEMLGVKVDLTSDDFSEIRVANKQDRVDEIGSAISKIVAEGQVCVRELPSLFGRLQFSEAQILGRCGRLALADLRSLERINAPTVQLGDDQKAIFLMLKRRLENDKPRTIFTCPSDGTTLVFTDGAYEPGLDGAPGVGSIGGVLFHWSSCSGWSCRAFGCILPSDLISRWSKGGKRHLIGQVEMSAVVVARVLWKRFLDLKRVIFFVDHGGVLASAIRGTSKERTWRELLLKFEEADAEGPCIGWFSRVPSKSNVSDGPSRGSFKELSAITPFTRDHPVCLFSSEVMSPSESMLEGELG